MSDDVLLRIINYLPKKVVALLVVSRRVSPMDVLMGRWERWLLRCNTMSVEKHFVIYKALLRKGRQDLIFQLSNYTLTQKKKRLAMLVFRNIRENADMMDIVTDERFIQEPMDASLVKGALL
jgi:hypothetical protein